MTRAARFWPAAVIGMLTLNVAGTLVFMWAANDDEANAVEPDYYRKAVAWDSTAAARRRAVDLGWALEATIGPIGSDGAADLSVTLRDRAGAAIEGATLAVVAIHNAHARHPLAAAVPAASPGRFESRLPLRWAGRWELRFEITRDGVRVPMSVRTEAVGP